MGIILISPLMHPDRLYFGEQDLVLIINQLVELRKEIDSECKVEPGDTDSPYKQKHSLQFSSPVHAQRAYLKLRGQTQVVFVPELATPSPEPSSRKFHFTVKYPQVPLGGTLGAVVEHFSKTSQIESGPNSMTISNDNKEDLKDLHEILTQMIQPHEGGTYDTDGLSQPQPQQTQNSDGTCQHDKNCYNPYCQLRHSIPLCHFGIRCINFACEKRHPPARKRKCKDETDSSACTNPHCNLLHRKPRR